MPGCKQSTQPQEPNLTPTASSDGAGTGVDRAEFILLQLGPCREPCWEQQKAGEPSSTAAVCPGRWAQRSCLGELLHLPCQTSPCASTPQLSATGMGREPLPGQADGQDTGMWQ